MTTITVLMTPIPQGSHSAFIVKTKSGMNRAVITDRNKPSLNAERVAIAEEWKRAGGGYYETEPISLNIRFSFIKPKSAKKSVIYKTTNPDIDKLSRAVLDSLTGVAYRDDSQVVRLDARKVFAQTESIEITVSEYADVQ